ncbi:MAG TPA: lipoate--protein ligase family protein [Methanomicrobia archaeon]|nr:lipoate--protein ligase family protein [Methanomicrobia archaeon]
MIVEHKAKGGLIKFDIEIKNSKIKDVKITGDFFIYPEDSVFALERKLRGKTEKESMEIIKDYLRTVEALGITIEDFKNLLKKAFEDKDAVQSN